jgi:hypothetical protein
VPRTALLGQWLPEKWSDRRHHDPDPTKPDWGAPARLRLLPPAVADLLGWDRKTGRERSSLVALEEGRSSDEVEEEEAKEEEEEDEYEEEARIGRGTLVTPRL